MFYYYAFIEKGVCIDIERTKREKTDMTDYVEVSQAEYDAYMNEDTASDDYIIGKLWNGSAWVTPEKFYYAVINEKNIVIDLVESDAEVFAENYISIEKADFESKEYLNQKWDVEQGKFVEVPFAEYADTDTTKVSVNHTNEPLQQLLDEVLKNIENIDVTMTADDILKAVLSVDGSGSGLDADTLDGLDSAAFAKASALAELANAIAGKAPANHAHTGYVDSGTFTNALAGKANASHGHTEYATNTALNNVVNALAGKADAGSFTIYNELVIGTYSGSGGYQTDSSQHIELGFSPRAVMIVPMYEAIIRASRYQKPGDSFEMVLNQIKGGFFVKGVNDEAHRGCVIDNSGFVAYSDYSNPSNGWLELNNGYKIYIALR